MTASAAFALQSWFFGQLIQVFQYTGDQLRQQRDFWALMFFILALAVTVTYFVLGWSSTTISAVGTCCHDFSSVSLI